MIDIFKIVEPFEEIIITGHLKPDGDAVGSCMATALYLKKIGKNPKVILEQYNKRYYVIPGREFLYEGNLEKLTPDVFISLDCGSIDRFTTGTKNLFDRARVTVNVDHHTSNDDYSDYNYVVSEASSTSELVFDLFKSIVPLDKNIATAIYAGIIYDTGGLRFPSTSQNTLKIAAKAMELGINYTEIYNDMLLKKSLSELRALTRVLQNLTIYDDYSLIISAITSNELKELDVTTNDLDGIVQFLLNIDKVDIAVFLYEIRNNVFKVSLRSTSLDVNKIASMYGGGGHRLASGCFMEGTQTDVIQKIKSHIMSELR